MNTTDFSNGITVANSSQVTFSKPGIYNLQFSAQLHNTGGGGNGTVVNIWFQKNGVDIPASNTRVTVNTNSPYVVAAWNIFVQIDAPGDYVELIWVTTNVNIVLEYEPATLISGVLHPAIPSVIFTCSQVA